MESMPEEPHENGHVAEGDAASTDHASLKERVLEVLHHVNDPELGINIVDLGLVYGVEIEDETVHITYTLTTMGCPIGPLIEAEITRFLADVPGVERSE